MLRDWTDSLKFDGISAEAERLFLRLIMKADDYGRFHADARLVKAACFPLIENLRTNELTRWLDELSTRQLILRYEAEGRSLLAIVNYGQRLKQSRAKFPPLPGKGDDWTPASGNFRELPGTSGNFRLEEKRREEKRIVATSGTSSVSRHHDAISWTIDNGFTGITDDDRTEWLKAYPAVNIERQIAAMNQWLKSNPSKAHKKAWRRFITSWLSRSQERGGDIRSQKSTTFTKSADEFRI